MARLLPSTPPQTPLGDCTIPPVLAPKNDHCPLMFHNILINKTIVVFVELISFPNGSILLVFSSTISRILDEVT